mgnify:CR=1 FL=1
MTLFTVGQLEIMTDVLSICLFGITSLLLVIMEIKYRRISPIQAPSENRVGFNEELVHVIKQTEKKDENNRTAGEQDTGAYENVGRLADLGLDAKEISKRVSIPRSEIELIVRLREFGLKSRMNIPELKIDTPAELPAEVNGITRKEQH